MAVEGGRGKDEPAEGRDRHHDDGRGKDGRPRSPARHPFRRRAAGPRQDDEVDAGERQIAAERDDDRLHPHPDHDQAENDLIERRRRRANKQRPRSETDDPGGAKLDHRHVDEADQRPDRQIDRGAPGERRRHQRIGRQDQRRDDDLRAADARACHEARTAQDRDRHQPEEQQDRDQQERVVGRSARGGRRRCSSGRRRPCLGLALRATTGGTRRGPALRRAGDCGPRCWRVCGRARSQAAGRAPASGIS